MKKAITLIFMLSLMCFSCLAPEDKINDLKRPVVIAAIGEDGSVLLRGGEGRCLLFPCSYYIAKAINGSGKAGDVLIPLPEE